MGTWNRREAVILFCNCRHFDGEAFKSHTECIRFNRSTDGAWSGNTEVQRRYFSLSLCGTLGLPPM